MSLVAVVILILVLWIILWSIAVFVLDAPSHRQYDSSVGELFTSHPDDISSETAFIDKLEQVHAKVVASKSLKKGLIIAREFADNLSQDLETQSAFTPIQIGEVDAEWVVAPNADSNRRVLFLHGGAFVLGSAHGHRKFSDRLSKVCNAAVLSVNYRMLPEHRRKIGVSDAQQAYQWIINNGPEQQQKCDFLLVAGDSAGGNLALMLSSWSKRQSHRRPDGVIGFSPSLDSTLSSPTLRSNRITDKILGSSLGKLCLVPRPMQLWMAFLLLRSVPCKPSISPLFYNLRDLPPTLIHVSSSEMLLGDAQRYANKAIAAGSDVTLQIWHDQIHDWHLFNMGTGSAENAWHQVEKFVNGLK